MNLKQFNYILPSSHIAQAPIKDRTDSRLMVVCKDTQAIRHDHFRSLPEYLRSGDVLVVNNSRVIPARFMGRKSTGARVEITLSRPINAHEWYVFTKTRAPLRDGDILRCEQGVQAVITDQVNPQTFERRIRFNCQRSHLMQVLRQIGYAPLPPYIHRKDLMTAEDRQDDLERYQTIYANRDGSVAAPTAGMHFSHALLGQLRDKGIEIIMITLHVGPGTFKPVTAKDIRSHIILPERYEISSTAIKKIIDARNEKRRIIAVGTSTTRALETVFENGEPTLEDVTGESDLFIYPSYTFKVVDALITNFHLPKSSLLMLVSALAGITTIQKAYRAAIDENYRFYSYGDAMLILP